LQNRRSSETDRLRIVVSHFPDQSGREHLSEFKVAA